ncbi:DUF4136 domain-containing protein [Azohydromonas sediminis]|uniref:DUF4136 domain-containing protein n=1 Tax=Azohydromonas sediminis TaxID=2259674 RepID=UPI000E65B49F|nr:DUF4136 domain-containing protein [Azohydromonas sediminis]
MDADDFPLHPGRRARTAALIALVAALAGCAAGPAVRTTALPEASACRSLGWMPPQANAPAATIADQKIRNAIQRTLDAAGRAPTAAAPACWVTFSTSRSGGASSGSGMSVGVGAGGVSGGSVGVGLGVGFSIPIAGGPVRDTRLTIDLVDAQRRQQVWSGSVDDAYASAAPADDDIERAVQAILAKLPPAR